MCFTCDFSPPCLLTESMEEGEANDDSIRRPSAASIQSRNLVLQPKSGLHASSLPNIAEELTWSFNGAMGGVYVANTLPPPSVSSPTKPLPFPIPNYEMQSTMSTVVLSDKTETTRTKTTTMDSTVTVSDLLCIHTHTVTSTNTPEHKHTNTHTHTKKKHVHVTTPECCIDVRTTCKYHNL